MGIWTITNISQQTLDKIHEQGYHDLEDYSRSIARYRRKPGLLLDNNHQSVMYNDVLQLAKLFGEDQLFTGLVDAVASM